jgi:tetratricopeptide (TPR) repeat protein
MNIFNYGTNRMAKRKKRKKGNNVAAVRMSAGDFLLSFKNSWNSSNSVASLNAYRGWTRRTGKKRDPGLEGELLFRCASNDFKSRSYERALQRLGEAREIDNANAERYDRFMAICLARNNRIEESAGIFSRLGDDFHAAVLMAMKRMELTLPLFLFNDPGVDRGQAASFCRAHFGVETAGGGSKARISQPALKNLDAAMRLLASGKNPEPPLELLGNKQGFEELASHLLIIASAPDKDIVKLYNALKEFPGTQRDDSFRVIATGVLVTAIREKKFKAVEQLLEIFNQTGITFKDLGAIKDEWSFQQGLSSAESGDFQAALYHFESISQPTSPVLHNIALCHQEFEEYGDANRYWIRLLAREKKPAPCASSEEAKSYIATLKYIANNYMEERDRCQAKKYFKEVLRYDKNDRDALYALTTISSLDGKRGEASSYAKRLHLLEPENDEYFAAYLFYIKLEDRLDEVISLCCEAMEDAARRENEIFSGIFTEAVAKKAWDLKDKNPEEVKRLIKMAEKYIEIKGVLLFIEGYYLCKEGRKKTGMWKMFAAVRSGSSHKEEFQMAVTLYEQGFKKQAIEAFENIGGCGCQTGMHYYFDAISYLARRNDYENTIHLCDYGLATLSMVPMDAAYVLFDAKKIAWAKKYSSQAVRNDNWSIEDGHFHLEILNRLGNRAETLEWARCLRDKAVMEGDDDNVELYSFLVDQLESKGRFRRP